MDALIAAAVRLSEESPVEDPAVPPYVIGGFAFLVLVVLLVVVYLMNVERSSPL
jgi:hypothetical protein